MVDTSESNSLTVKWNLLQSSNRNTAINVLGMAKRKQPDWFADSFKEMQILINGKNAAYQIYENKNTRSAKKEFTTARHLLQRTRQLKNDWSLAKAIQIQHFVDTNDMRNFHNSLKELYDPAVCGPNPIYSSEGKIFKKCLIFWRTEKDTYLTY